MTKDEIKVCEQVIGVLNKASFNKLKAGQMFEYSQILRAFGHVIKKYSDKLTEEIKPVEAKTKIETPKDNK